MTLRSDDGVYVDLVGPPGSDVRTRQMSPVCWDTDYDACQQGSSTQLPHADLPVVAGTDPKSFRFGWAMRGPCFNNFSIYLKQTVDLSTLAARPPIFVLDIRFGVPCVCDHWQFATCDVNGFQQKGLLVSGVTPIFRAMEIWGAVITEEGLPTPPVPLRVQLRVILGLSANDLGVATFETPPAATTNGITVTLGP